MHASILTDFDAGISVSRIAKKLGMSITGVSNILKKYDRKPVAPSVIEKQNWESLHNESPLFFYFLGWIMADGCIMYIRRGGRQRGIMLYLTVHTSDKHIVEFFRDQFYKTLKIGYHGNTARLMMAIPRIVATKMSEWGVVPRKTYEFRLTDRLIGISDTNFLQFLVGFIEGDGAIDVRSLKSKGKSYSIPRIRMCNGSLELMSWIASRIESLGFKKRKIEKRKNHAYYAGYSVAGIDATKLGSMLVSQPFHRLNRKWEKLCSKMDDSSTRRD